MYLEETVPWLGGEGDPRSDESKKTEEAYFEGVGLDYHGIEVLETAFERSGKEGVNERAKEAQSSIEYKKG